jgi:hypothetical protein
MHEDLKRHQVWRYQPYAPLAEESAEAMPGSQRLAQIKDLIADQEYTLSLERSSSLIQDALQGLRYLET